MSAKVLAKLKKHLVLRAIPVSEFFAESHQRFELLAKDAVVFTGSAEQCEAMREKIIHAAIAVLED